MFNIQFEFDPEASKITNLKVTKLDFSKKDAIITVEDNKLVLSTEACKLLQASANDRIVVNYWTQDSETTFPVIGKAEVFSDETDGNRLTKSNTVSFRGTQRDILLEYGKIFKIEPFKSYFKMVSLEVNNDNLTEEEKDLISLV